jgi:hypothetical protein
MTGISSVAFKARLKFFGILVGIQNILFGPFLLFLLKNSFLKLRFKIPFYLVIFTSFFLLYPILYSRDFNGLYFVSFGINYFYSVFLIFLSGLIASNLPEKEAIALAYNVSIGMLLKTAFVTFISLIYLDQPLYGNIYNFYTGTVGNSVQFSNALCYFGLSYFLLIKKKYITDHILFLLSLICGLILEGRTFFLVVFLSFLYSFFSRNRKVESLRNFSLIALGVYIVGKITNIDLYHFFSRFTNEGIESPRINLYFDYFRKFHDDPFGKIQPDYSEHIWFHNILMDTHSATGFYMMLFLMLLFAYPILKFYISKNILSKEFFALILALSILMTSVPIDGGELNTIAYFLLLSILLMKLGRNEKG